MSSDLAPLTEISSPLECTGRRFWGTFSYKLAGDRLDRHHNQPVSASGRSIPISVAQKSDLFHITTKMKLAIVFFAVAVVVVSGRPQFGFQPAPVIPVLLRDEVRDEAGQFTLRYVTGDGTTVSEAGQLVPNNEGDDNVLVKQGSYTFTSPEGQTFTVEYISDANGFRASGAHLPQSVQPIAPTF
ncbi:larval cuticle protein 65Ag1-like [Ischnura elegans]|uniref:larval cuticle protein 65Ag1-like n=1 Tax=Ischnura elegans TaxID=197161 RepID=UPI001ED87C03|nr:larval cuticle protein 65Ag1-like [Ischnura elegans]